MSSQRRHDCPHANVGETMRTNRQHLLFSGLVLFATILIAPDAAPACDPSKFKLCATSQIGHGSTSYMNDNPLLCHFTVALTAGTVGDRTTCNATSPPNPELDCGAPCAKLEQLLLKCPAPTIPPFQIVVADQHMAVCQDGCGGRHWCDQDVFGNLVYTHVSISGVSGSVMDMSDQASLCIPLYLGTCRYADDPDVVGGVTTSTAEDGHRVCCELTAGLPTGTFGCPCSPDVPPQ